MQSRDHQRMGILLSNFSSRMVSTRTSSKKYGTGSTPPTGDRDFSGQPKQLPGSPCFVAKKTGHKRDVRGDMLSVKKLIPKHNTSPEKSRTETALASSAEQSTELTEGEYVIPQNRWKHLQVNKIGPSTKVIEHVLSQLDGEQIEQFKQFSVGHLLDVDPSCFGFWPGLIHGVLLHQLYYPATSDLVFNFSNRITTFGCKQFCIVTGLPYVGQLNFPPSSGRLLKKYGRGGKLKREALLDAFTRCTDKLDQVKIDVAYLVEGLIFSKAKEIFVRPEILGLVDDVHAFNWVAWEKLGWEYMAPTLKEYCE